MTQTNKILIVDDDSGVQNAVRRLLQRIGYVVETAGDGVEALAVVGRFRPDLVLLDVSMPRMDGIEALKKLSQLNPKPRVIMLTALGDVESLLLKPSDRIKIGRHGTGHA